jgi:hypothetical protein
VAGKKERRETIKGTWRPETSQPPLDESIFPGVEESHGKETTILYVRSVPVF